ncbi:MAG: hypothetical protein KJO48_02755 [Ignavibacteria bacterium]|nr:hypothetical protein [Ignavibacteria bacterium]
MAESQKLTLTDYLVYIVKYRRVLIITLLLTGLIGYLTVYLVIEEQFDSVSVIIPSEDEGMGGIAGLLGSLQDLPLDITSGVSSEEMGMYNTIIYSRTMLEKVIKQFNLIDVYELSRSDPRYMEKAVETLASSITTMETPNYSYEIETRAPSANLTAQINNYIIEELNKKIIELKVEKSRNNRIFLAERVAEIEYNLKLSEDSLKEYQEDSGLLDAESQIKAIIEAYAGLETELITKQIEESILEQIYPSGHPQLEDTKIAVQQYQKKLDKLKMKNQNNSMLLALNSLPQKAIDYFRNFRNLQINSTILEFIIPLYEQAKFEEQKNVPVLQVVDYAIPPAKKSYPPRTIFTLLLMFGAFVISFFFILLKENPNLNKSDKYLYIRKNLFRWKDK